MVPERNLWYVVSTVNAMPGELELDELIQMTRSRAEENTLSVKDAMAAVTEAERRRFIGVLNKQFVYFSRDVYYPLPQDSMPRSGSQ